MIGEDWAGFPVAVWDGLRLPSLLPPSRSGIIRQISGQQRRHIRVCARERRRCRSTTVLVWLVAAKISRGKGAARHANEHATPGFRARVLHMHSQTHGTAGLSDDNKEPTPLSRHVKIALGGWSRVTPAQVHANYEQPCTSYTSMDNEGGEVVVVVVVVVVVLALASYDHTKTWHNTPQAHWPTSSSSQLPLALGSTPLPHPRSTPRSRSYCTLTPDGTRSAPWAEDKKSQALLFRAKT